jgi:hypothetical protein
MVKKISEIAGRPALSTRVGKWKLAPVVVSVYLNHLKSIKVVQSA